MLRPSLKQGRLKRTNLPVKEAVQSDSSEVYGLVGGNTQGAFLHQK